MQTDFQLTQHLTSPTLISGSSATLIDHVISTILLSVSSIFQAVGITDRLFNARSSRVYNYNSYTHAPWSLRNLLTRRPEAVAHERSEGATKGLRVYKFRRLHGACV